LWKVAMRKNCKQRRFSMQSTRLYDRKQLLYQAHLCESPIARENSQIQTPRANLTTIMGWFLSATHSESIAAFSSSDRDLGVYNVHRRMSASKATPSLGNR
jgi:hypothetical protein